VGLTALSTSVQHDVFRESAKPIPYTHARTQKSVIHNGLNLLQPRRMRRIQIKICFTQDSVQEENNTYLTWPICLLNNHLRNGQIRRVRILQHKHDFLRYGRSGFGGSIPGGGWEVVLLLRTGSGAHPASCPRGTGRGGGGSARVKRPGREADHSLPSSADVKNAWRYVFTPMGGA
jgi:hypothetical protein